MNRKVCYDAGYKEGYNQALGDVEKIINILLKEVKKQKK